jgi:hypothetical protein
MTQLDGVYREKPLGLVSFGCRGGVAVLLTGYFCKGIFACPGGGEVHGPRSGQLYIVILFQGRADALPFPLIQAQPWWNATPRRWRIA